MSMYYIVFSIAFTVSVLLNVFGLTNKTNKQSIANVAEQVKKYLKESQIRAIVNYQNKYNGSDQLVFMAKWIQQVKDKIKSAPVEQKKLFKEIVNGL